jgi:NAD(P)-dependent dehydrogenase (short-subunit alcohol dehydrogenase family)
MTDPYFAGKVLAITGGASGMALQTAKHLAAKGCKISIADVQDAGLQKAKADIEAANGLGSCLIVKTDVRSQSEVEAWIAETMKAFGRIDFCANLAAVVGKDICIKPTEEITNEDWNFVLAVNLTGMMNCLRAEIPHLKSGAAIVNFASVSGQRGFALNGAYCASKHGVIGFCKCTAKKLGPKGIRLNIVCP